MKTKTVKLHTYDLQKIVIALIYHSVELAHDKSSAKREEATDYDRLAEIIGDWNDLVNEDNDWTVNVTVEG